MRLMLWMLWMLWTLWAVAVPWHRIPAVDLPKVDTISPGFQAQGVTIGDRIYRYQVFIPAEYTRSEHWPIILAMHGSDQRGNDNYAQLAVGLGPYVAAHAAAFPAIVVFPQMPKPSPGWLVDTIALAALDHVLKDVSADSARIYLTGLSLGAYRVWEIAYRTPTRFAALVPIAGGICPACLMPGLVADPAAYRFAAQMLKELPIRTFHGGKDDPSAERAIAAAFADAGSKAFHYAEYPDLGHDVWDVTYADPEFWNWLFAQHR